MNKLKFLEGIRGIMAINVVICHFICVYYPQMYFIDFAQQEMSALSLFAVTPLSILVNGNIAVKYFLVLTGFLVGKSVLTQKPIDAKLLLEKSCNRYLRILPMVLIATAVTFLTMCFNLQYHLEIVDLAKNGNFLLSYCNFNPTIMNFLSNMFIRPFIMGSSYVRPFWTIKYEFLGYIFALVVCFFANKSRFSRWIYVICIIVCWKIVSIHYAPLFLGLLIADFYYKREKPSKYMPSVLNDMIYKKWFYGVCLVGGVCLAACPSNLIIREIVYKISEARLIRSIGVSAVLYGLLNITFLQKKFEWAPFVWLGEMSFEIYALHWPIMLVLEARMFAYFYEFMNYDAAAILAFAITIVAIIGMSYMVSRFISQKIHFDIRLICQNILKISNQTNIKLTQRR